MSRTEASSGVLVSCQWLANHLSGPEVRLIEVSSNSDDAAYREGRIIGAVWWFWKKVLWHLTDRVFITPEQLAEQPLQLLA